MLERIHDFIKHEAEIDIPWVKNKTAELLTKSQHFVSAAPRVLSETITNIRINPGRSAATLFLLSTAACSPSPGINNARIPTRERPPATPTRLIPREPAVSTMFTIKPPECPPKQDSITGLTLDFRPFENDLLTGNEEYTIQVSLDRFTGAIEFRRSKADDLTDQTIGLSRYVIPDNSMLLAIPEIQMFSADSAQIDGRVIFIIRCAKDNYLFDISNSNYSGKIKIP